MKCLQIVGDSAFGGATYLILRWCEFLVRNGCEVDVISTDDQTIEALLGIGGVHVFTDVYIPRDISLTVDLRAFTRLLRLLRQSEYDVVHTYTATPGFIGRIAARLGGVPAIFHHQAAWTVSEESFLRERLLYTPLEYLAALASTRGICVSHAVASQATALHIAPPQKLVTICNGIDAQPLLRKLGYRDEVRNKLGIGSGTLVLGVIGRLSKQKDVLSVLRAISKLHERSNMPFVLLIIGDGPERSNLEAAAIHLGITNRVCFLGFRKDISSLLGAVDIYISASLREGLSISVLEAMITARPIIATSIAPNAELIEHGKTGLLVETQAPEQILSAIIQYVNDPNCATSCGQNAQKRALENYTLERMFNQTWQLYTSFARR